MSNIERSEGETVAVDTILAWLDPVLPLHDEALPERLRGPLVRLRDNYQGAVSDRDALLRYIHENSRMHPREPDGCSVCAGVMAGLDAYRGQSE